MHFYNGKSYLARNMFEEVLKRDSLRIEAYHSLAMATSKSKELLKGLLKRVEDVTELRKKWIKNSEGGVVARVVVGGQWSKGLQW